MTERIVSHDSWAFDRLRFDVKIGMQPAPPRPPSCDFCDELSTYVWWQRHVDAGGPCGGWTRTCWEHSETIQRDFMTTPERCDEHHLVLEMIGREFADAPPRPRREHPLIVIGAA